MTSKEIKAAMLGHMLYGLHHVAAITEYGGKGVHGIADCFGINDNGFTSEFEVKCSRADLMGELNAIEYITKQEGTLIPGERPKTYSKALKHKVYLKPNMISMNWIRENAPNYFSFCIPEKLKEIALQKLEGTPYGLYIVHWHENGGNPWNEVICVKKSKKMHINKACDEQKNAIMRKCCTEIHHLRIDAISLKLQIKGQNSVAV